MARFILFLMPVFLVAGITQVANCAAAAAAASSGPGANASCISNPAPDSPQLFANSNSSSCCCPPCKPDSNAYRNKSYQCPIQITLCRPVCLCIKDYYRNDANICVPVKDCPHKGPINSCGVNEEWRCRMISCQKDICESLVARYICEVNEICTSGCYCKSGYLREDATQPCKLSCKCDVMKHSPGSC